MKGMALLAALLAAGCGTMIHGRSQQIPVASSPSGAAITLACDAVQAHHAGYTPATITLDRGDSGCRITLSKLGYREETIHFHRVRAGTAIAGDVVSGLFLGAVTGLAVQLPTELLLGDEAGEILGDAAFAAGASVPFAVDERSGAAFRHVPEEVRVALVPRP